MMKRVTLVAIVLSCAAAASADVVIPAAFAGTSTGTVGFNTVLRAFDRSVQAIYGASTLSGLNVGDRISGVAFRMFFTTNNPNTWPTADINWANYDIYMSTTSVTPGSQSTTYIF